MKNIKKILLTLVLIFVSCFMIYNVTADSGWDSSYGGGGSSGGSSGSHGGSHGGSGSNNSEYWENSPISMETAAIIFGCAWVIFVGIAITLSIKNEKKKQLQSGNLYNDFDSSSFKDITQEKLNKFDETSTIENLKKSLFETYRDIQYAWMEFDTDKIRTLTTDELYNMYSSQLETLKLKGQKNIMKDIVLNDIKIIDIKEENEVINLNVYLNVECYDYVISEKTNKVLRGKFKNKIEIEYIITFVKSGERIEDKVKCPNCSAFVEMNASSECPFCGSTLVDDSNKYVMSKKTCVGQRTKG